ncbi:hypothetical protein MA16_Dca015763 [Dendrobium catenatum]|uniref:Uncharacterized protein n=1 Tax=Dendrobium catenatum TaxID=906689 RepID=A0A2I0VQN7_9ASPA|nr:hypothetical protein MA16_Dca015763 [Dendrobium catenatum]
MSNSSKRSHLTAGSSSSFNSHSAWLLSAKNEEAYHKYKAWKITPSKMLNQAALNYKVMNLFASNTFQFLLTLAFPYNSKLLLEFLENLTYTIDNTTFHSFIFRQNIEITRADIDHYIGLSTEVVEDMILEGSILDSGIKVSLVEVVVESKNSTEEHVSIVESEVIYGGTRNTMYDAFKMVSREVDPDAKGKDGLSIQAIFKIEVMEIEKKRLESISGEGSQPQQKMEDLGTSPNHDVPKISSISL